MNETENTIDLMEEKSNAETTQVTVVSTINKLYAEAETLSKSAKEYAEKAVGIALECGRLLIEQKKQVGHGNWYKWCEDNLSFSTETARKYMNLSRKMLTEDEDGANPNYGCDLGNAQPKTLRQAYIATGILPESTKPKDTPENIEADKARKQAPIYVQNKHIQNIDSFIKWLRKVEEDNPMTQWTQHTRQSMMLNLRPVVEIFQNLKELEPDFLKHV